MDVTNSRSNMIFRSNGAKALESYLLDQIKRGQIQKGFKLPPERELCELFSASRNTVRRVLAKLKDQGLITQTMGSGTFVADRARENLPSLIEDRDFADTISPAELIQARILIEPLMPILIARNGTATDFQRMTDCLLKSEAATTLQEFDHWNNELHRAIAEATHNTFFLKILELTNNVRQMGGWGRLRRDSMTPGNRGVYEIQHRAIVQALCDRDAKTARDLMEEHLLEVQANFFQDVNLGRMSRASSLDRNNNSN
ncbi:MAG: transcriptional regulator, GntR family [Herminiimonas sp.]|nr:transcriptional regulator, GntR family [Herminiimonas sp.]